MLIQFRMPRRRASQERRDREKRIRSALRQAHHQHLQRQVLFRHEAQDITEHVSASSPASSETAESQLAHRRVQFRSEAVGLSNPQIESSRIEPKPQVIVEDDYLQIDGREFSDNET